MFIYKERKVTAPTIFPLQGLGVLTLTFITSIVTVLYANICRVQENTTL